MFFLQGREGFPDPAVAVNIKIIRVQEMCDIKIRIRVNQYRAKQSFFGLPAEGNGGRNRCFFGSHF
jgi:hypothetical protein